MPPEYFINRPIRIESWFTPSNHDRHDHENHHEILQKLQPGVLRYLYCSHWYPLLLTDSAVDDDGIGSRRGHRRSGWNGEGLLTLERSKEKFHGTEYKAEVFAFPAVPSDLADTFNRPPSWNWMTTDDNDDYQRRSWTFCIIKFLVAVPMVRFKLLV